MSVDFEITGMAQFEARLDRITKSAAVEVRKAIGESANRVRDTARGSIKKISIGKPYVRYSGSGKRKGIASKKGEAPNNDLGNLWDNIRVSPGASNFGKGYYVLVRSIAPYSKHLEEKLKRPFMKPALEKNQKKIRQLLKSAINGSLKAK